MKRRHTKGSRVTPSTSATPPDRIVVVGASAGGIEAARTLLGGLPTDLPAPVLVVIHVAPTEESNLDRILGRSTPLPVHRAADGAAMENGHVYVAPPDHHLLVRDGRMVLSRGPTEHHSRPAIDPLFRTAAAAFGASVVAIVLSGALDDGTSGLRAVRVAGGVGVVQDPAEAPFSDMPRSASRYAEADKVVARGVMADLVDELVRALPGTKARRVEDQVERARDSDNGTLADLTCPSCRGGLREQNIDGRLEYECRIGHRFSEKTLLLGQSDQIDAALWSALAALEERADLCRRMSVRRKGAGHERSAARYDMDAEQAESQASLLRHLLLTGQLDPAIATDADVEDAR